MTAESFLNGRVVLHPGCMLEVLASLPENSVDAILCDPPYHLQSIVKRFALTGRTESTRTTSGPHQRTANGFMGKQWDGGDIAFQPATWAAVLRVLKPGGYILAFSSSRTFGRMSVAMEDAGFITHPMIGWVFGSGFPKATRLKASGYEGQRYGTQSLKPALEPIYMGQKPFSEPTGTANVLRWGTGAVNIDACRIGDGQDRATGGLLGKKRNSAHGFMSEWIDKGNAPSRPSGGRWPANLIHDGSDEVVAAFPETHSAGVARTADQGTHRGRSGMFGLGEAAMRFGDGGGSAARFFAACQADDDELLFCAAKAIFTECNSVFANTADSLSRLSSELVAFVVRDAATSALRGTTQLSLKSWKVLSTSVTPIELKRISESAIAAILCLEKRLLPELPLEKLILNGCRASIAETSGQTDTITITISHWKSDGSAEAATFDFMLKTLAPGAAVLGFAERHVYAAKATDEERAGAKHPTVKPQSLLRYGARLITPVGGTILDCFAGTGSTGEAAYHEGFNAILIEREPEYQADIRRRMALILAGRDERKRAIIKAKGKPDDLSGTLFGAFGTAAE